MTSPLWDIDAVAAAYGIVDVADAIRGQTASFCPWCQPASLIIPGPVMRLSSGVLAATSGICPECLLRMQTEAETIKARHFHGPCLRCGHMGPGWRRKRYTNGLLIVQCPECRKRMPAKDEECLSRARSAKSDGERGGG